MGCWDLIPLSPGDKSQRSQVCQVQGVLRKPVIPGKVRIQEGLLTALLLLKVWSLDQQHRQNLGSYWLSRTGSEPIIQHTPRRPTGTLASKAPVPRVLAEIQCPAPTKTGGFGLRRGPACPRVPRLLRVLQLMAPLLGEARRNLNGPTGGGSRQVSLLRRPLAVLPVPPLAAFCPALPSRGHGEPLPSHMSPSLQPISQDPADHGERTCLSLTFDVRCWDYQEHNEGSLESSGFSS